MTVRTNLLMDVLTVPNIGLDFYLGKQISISPQWMYAWWKNSHHNRFWRLYGGDITVSYHLQSSTGNKFSGHHFGLYAGIFTFDFEWGKTGYIGGKPGGNLWNQCLVNTGVVYGYSLPISSRFDLDFSIGLGYITGKIEKYRPHNDLYIRESISKIHYFGPTRLEISLVWLIGKSNFNLREGGKK